MYTSQWTLKQLKSLLSEKENGDGQNAAPTKGSTDSTKNQKEDSRTKVIILVNENSPALSSLLFLRKKNYSLKILHKLSDAIGEIASQKPDVVMISWNLRRVDVKKVFYLLSKNFKTLCVVFGEDNSSKTSKEIMRCGIPYTILPPLSGPGIHMRLQSLLRNRKSKKQKQKTKMEVDVNIAGKKKNRGYTFEKEEYQMVKSSPQLLEQTKTPLFRIVNNFQDVPKNTKWDEVKQPRLIPDDDNKVFEGKARQNNRSEYFYYKGQQMPSFDEEKQQWKVEEENVDLVVTERLADATLLEAIQKGKLSDTSLPDENDPSYYLKGGNVEEEKDEAMVFERDEVKTKMHEAVQEGADPGKEYEFTQEGPNQGKEYEFTQEGIDSETTNPGVESENEMDEQELKAALEKAMLSTDEPVIEENSEELLNEFEMTQEGQQLDEDAGNVQIKNHKKDNAKYTITHDSPVELKGIDSSSILAKCLRQAVTESSGRNSTEPNPIRSVSKVTVTIIKTSRFRGYLVGGNASDIPDRNLMKKVMGRLTESMDGAGEPMEAVTGILELNFDPLPFMLWAEQKAEFYVKSISDGDEIVFAYIPTEQLPEVIQTEQEHLFAVDLTKFIADQKLLFDVYIHMPKNNKFLLYLKKGSVFLSKTINKLSKFAIKYVYIKKSEMDLYFTYCAKQKFLETTENLSSDPKKKVS